MARWTSLPVQSRQIEDFRHVREDTQIAHGMFLDVECGFALCCESLRCRRKRVIGQYRVNSVDLG